MWKITNWKKVFHKCKAIHALKQPKTLLVCWVNQKFKIVFLKSMVCIAMNTAQKMKFSIKDFFSKCDQIRSKLRICSHLLKKSVIENFIFCAVEYKDSCCKLCASYIQNCSNFITSNGYNWKIRCYINCHSTNVLYFLSCNSTW